jgi:heme A synthase
MEQLGYLIASILGSAGIMPVAIAAVQRMGASRSRRFLSEVNEMLEKTPSDSPVYDVLRQTKETVMLRLTAPLLSPKGPVERGATTLVAVFICLLITLTMIFMGYNVFITGASPDSVSSLILAIVVFACYMIFAAVVLYCLDQHAREKMVHQKLLEIPRAIDTPEIRRARRMARSEKRRKSRFHDQVEKREKRMGVGQGNKNCQHE